MNINGGLVIRGCRICFGLADRDGCIAFDHHRHHTAHRFYTERKRSDIEQKNILDFTTKHTGLNGRANRNNLIRIDTFVRFLAIRQAAYQILNHWHAR